jgi:hypothetical protein
MNDDQPEPRPVRRPSGDSRANIIRRLRSGGFDTLVDQVASGQMSARKAAILAGFGDLRVRVRKGEHVLNQREWQQWQRFLQQQREAKSKPVIDVRALVG